MTEEDSNFRRDQGRKFGKNMKTLTLQMARLITLIRLRSYPEHINQSITVSTKSHSHNTNECINLKDVIEELVKKG